MPGCQSAATIYSFSWDHWWLAASQRLLFIAVGEATGARLPVGQLLLIAVGGATGARLPVSSCY